MIITTTRSLSSTLLALGERQIFPGGAQFMGQGEPSSAAYLLVQGIVKLQRLEANGHEAIVNLCWPGSIIGSSALELGLPSPVTAVAIGKCEVNFLSKSVYSGALLSKEVLMELYRLQCRESIEHQIRIFEVASESTRVRLLRFLRVLSQARGTVVRPDGNHRLQLPLKDCDLASFLSVTPSHLSRMLSQLEHDGVLKRKDGWILMPAV